MRLSLLAAPLAALFVLGCSSEKSTPPITLASAAPQEKPPAQPSRETADPAPRPTADPALGAAGSPPAQHEDPAKDTDKPTDPPDPYAGVRSQWVSPPEQVEEMLEPVVKGLLHAAYNRKLKEQESKAYAVTRLGTYKLKPLPPETEKNLRALIAEAKDTEIAARGYLIASDSLLGGKGRLLAAAYEQVIDQGTVVPKETRDQLDELLKWENPNEVLQPQGELTGVITEQAESVRTKLLTQSVWGHDIFDLAVPIETLGRSVIEKRHLSRTFHDLLAALPEPQRSDIMVQLAWSPVQEAALDGERAKLKQAKPSRLSPKELGMTREERPRYEAEYTKELEAIAAKQREKFLQLEQARREVIEGFFTNLDAHGSAALVAINKRLTNLQAVLDHIVKDLAKAKLDYRFKPLVLTDAPKDAASDVLSRIALSGSVKDRVPTIRISDFEIVLDAPEGQISYADLLKPGNVLIGTFRLEEEGEVPLQVLEVTYEAELHIAAIVKKVPSGINGPKRNVFQGELVVTPPHGDRESLPFEGWLTSAGFLFRAPWKTRPGDLTFFRGSLDKGGPLTGGIEILGSPFPNGSFSFSLKK